MNRNFWPRSSWGSMGTMSGVGLLLASTAFGNPPEKADPLLQAVSVDSIWTDALYLGSDYLAGRAPGTLGGDRAAEYLAGRMERIGLVPMGDNGSYLQHMPLYGGTPLLDTRLTLSRDGERIDLDFEEDFLLYTTGAGTRISTPLPMVFAGYGIVAPEFDYNDYQNLDPAGSIVVFLSGEPYSDDPSYFEGGADTRHALPIVKQLTALARGAAGTIMIPDPRIHGDRTWDEWVRMFGFEHVTSPYNPPKGLDVLVHPDRASLLFEGSHHRLAEVYDMDARGRMQTFPLAWKADFHGAFRERDFLSANVIGLLPGSDPDLHGTCVLVSAHYDHLGTGPALDGDSIYNGVVDNALGTAMALEIARVLAASPEPLRRTVVFLLTTAEEKGLLGARFYCRHPVFPLHNTVANVNIDGAAIIDTFDDVVGVGGSLSTLERYLEEAVLPLGLSVSPVPARFRREAFLMSDQYAFAEAGIPSILIMEGQHYRNLSSEAGFAAFMEWSATRYHTPKDDLEQGLNLLAVREHCRVNLALITTLARSDVPPEWHPGTPHVAARLRSRAEGN